MSLSTFFNDPDNFVTREKIFLNKLCFDLKLAAAHRHMPLQIFTPEVDRGGFDIIVDDSDIQRRFQLKSFTKSSGTSSWKIHKRLLRPEFQYAEALGFEFSPEGVGLGGGLIVISIDETDDACPVTYHYTDVFILTAFAEGLITGLSKTQRENVTKVLQELHRGSGRERVSVPLSLCLKVRSPSSLLAIAGYHSTEASYQWWSNLLTALRDGFRINETPASDEPSARATTAQAAFAAQSLLSLVDEPTLAPFKKIDAGECVRGFRR
jgi:hypothetical protein